MREASALKAWVALQIAEFVRAADTEAGAVTQRNEVEVLSFDLIAGDASPRKYYRATFSAINAYPRQASLP